MTIHFTFFLHWEFISLKQWFHIPWFHDVLPRLPVRSRRFVTSSESATAIRLSGTLKYYSADSCLTQTNVISLPGPHPQTGNAHNNTDLADLPQLQTSLKFNLNMNSHVGSTEVKTKRFTDQLLPLTSPVSSPPLPHMVTQRAPPIILLQDQNVCFWGNLTSADKETSLPILCFCTKTKNQFQEKQWENFEKRKPWNALHF